MSVRLRDVLAEYGERCIYCGAPADTRDHLIPTSRGGQNVMANLRPACQTCNVTKADRTPAEWLGEKCPPEFEFMVAPPRHRRWVHPNERAALARGRNCHRCNHSNPPLREICSRCGDLVAEP